jgi:P-type Cu+ transporter
MMTTACAHCGDVCEQGGISDGEHSFCCDGCRSVYEILRSHDLCTYYDLDSKPASSMKGTTSDEFAALDDPGIARHFIEFESAAHRRLRFEIPSMHCASCVWLLEQLDRLDPGIRASEVDLMRKVVRVEIDPGRTTTRSVATLLASIGYRPLIRAEGAAGSSPAIRKIYLQLGVAGFAAGNVMMFSIARYFAGPSGMAPSLIMLFDVLSIVLSIPVLVYSASSWWRSAWSAVRRKTVNLDVPVALGIAVLFVRSVVDIVLGRSEGFLDSFTGLVFFLLIGRLFQQKAFDAVSFDRTYRSFFPLSVRVERRGEEHIVGVDAVAVGDAMLVRNGEVIPCDAVMLSRVGYVDYSFVSGESVPVECTEGSIVYAGGRVVGGQMRLTATKVVSHGYLASLWDKAGQRTPRTRLTHLADLFGKYFTIGAVGVAMVGAMVWLPDLRMSVDVLTAVLIIACPCALTIAAPATLGSAMALLGRRGVFIKNIGVLLDLAPVDTVVVDKTGTLTSTTHEVRWSGREVTADEVAAIASVAAQSTHPVSRSIAAFHDLPPSTVADVTEHPGQGIVGRVGDLTVQIGSASYVNAPDERSDVAAWVAIDGTVAGAYVLQAQLRDGIGDMLCELRERVRVRLLSGDTERDRPMFREHFDDAEMRFRATPFEKVEDLRRVRSDGGHVLMIGDGLNDAGAMAEADVAVAVTEDTATLVPACDVIMRAAQLPDVPRLLRYARQMKRVIWWNLAFSMVYNVLGLWLAIAGLLSPVIVAIMMPVSSLIVIGVSVAGARWYGRSSIWAS